MFRSPELDLSLANEQLERDLRERRLIRVVKAGRQSQRRTIRIAIGHGVIRLGLWLAADQRARAGHDLTRFLPTQSISEKNRGTR